MNDTILIPVELYKEIQNALNEVRATTFVAKHTRCKDTYDLASMLSRYYDAATKDLETFPISEDPTTCPYCGARTLILDDHKDVTLPWEEWCPRCGFVFQLVEDD